MRPAIFALLLVGCSTTRFVDTPGARLDLPHIAVLWSGSYNRPLGDAVLAGCSDGVAKAGRMVIDAKQLPEVTERPGETAASYYRDRARGQVDAFVTYQFSYLHFSPMRLRSLIAFLVDAESGVIARAVAWTSSDNAEPQSMARRICRALILGEKN